MGTLSVGDVKMKLRRWLPPVILLFLLASSAGARVQNPEGAGRLKILVRQEWATLPPVSLSERVRLLARRLSENPIVHLARSADTDDDGLNDLVAAPKAVPDLPYHRGPVAVWRGADLGAGRLQPYLLPSAGDVSKVEYVADVNGDGRTEVVITYETHGSGGHVPWLFYRWDGARYERIFDALVDNWRGSNKLEVGPGRVVITCRPLGMYDHKFAPHRVHTEVWTWREGAYRFASHYAPPPPSPGAPALPQGAGPSCRGGERILAAVRPPADWSDPGAAGAEGRSPHRARPCR